MLFGSEDTGLEISLLELALLAAAAAAAAAEAPALVPALICWLKLNPDDEDVSCGGDDEL